MKQRPSAARSLVGLPGRLAGAAVIVAGMLVAASVVANASFSAFSSTTPNGGNAWSTGTVALTNDSSSTALFTASGLRPGSTGTRCISVTSNGTLPSAVKLYGTGYSTTNSLGSSITLTVTQGTSASFGSCSGFVADASGSSIYSGTLDAFGTTSLGYSSGLGSWTPTGTAGESKAFQFTYTVSSSVPNAAQSSTASIGFTWESQST